MHAQIRVSGNTSMTFQRANKCLITRIRRRSTAQRHAPHALSHLALFIYFFFFVFSFLLCFFQARFLLGSGLPSLPSFVVLHAQNSRRLNARTKEAYKDGASEIHSPGERRHCFARVRLRF